MVKLTKKDVEHVAKLANLELSDEEKETYSKQLSDIVSFVDSLKEVDTINVEPTSQTTGLRNVFRKDEIDSENVLPQKEALSGVDNTENGYFVTDQLIDKSKL